MAPPSSFSIIVPAYNAADTIARTLTSVREAVLFGRGKGMVGDCEVIVVDDCSSDDSVAVAQAQDSLDCPIRILRHEVNQGAGSARNTGAAQAVGDILCFIDADDVYLPTHLAVCAGAFVQRPNIDYVCTRFTTSRPIDPSWIPAISAASVGCIAIRREAHERLGGFPPLRNFEDVFYRRLADQVLTGWYVSNETTVYVWRPGNSFDRQLAKFQMPLGSVKIASEDMAPAEVVEAFNQRLSRLRAEGNKAN